MSNESLKFFGAVMLLLGFFMLTIFAMAYFDRRNAESFNNRLCEPYRIVPEEHIDRVPPACTTDYFQYNKGVK